VTVMESNIENLRLITDNNQKDDLKRKDQLVRNILILVCVLALLFCESGCRNSSKQRSIVEPPEIPSSRTLTLSQQQLVYLDWHSPNRPGTKVTGKRIVPDSGVEFDIYFPSNATGNRTVNYVSSGQGGRGTLIGADIRGYEAFALKFTLVSIDGQTAPELKEKVAVGALIGPTATGRLSDYKPVTLSMVSPEKSLIAKTPMRVDKIRQIGFHVRMLNPHDWKPTGSMVTLRVEPVADAGAVPWPISGQSVQNSSVKPIAVISKR